MKPEVAETKECPFREIIMFVDDISNSEGERGHSKFCRPQTCIFWEKDKHDPEKDTCALATKPL